MLNRKATHIVGLSLSLGVLAVGIANAAVGTSPFVYRHRKHTFKNGALSAHTTFFVEKASKSGKKIWFKSLPKTTSKSTTGISPLALTNPYPETPNSLRALYGVPSYANGSGAIALIEAYDDPNALQDFNLYCSLAGLPPEPSTDPTNPNNQVLQVVYASGNQPIEDPRGPTNWDIETSLDIELTHGIAPNAKIYLVEADSRSFNDLANATLVGESLPGVTEVSMSWGVPEDPSESGADFAFTYPGVTFFAATGDSGAGTQYPSTSPNVTAVGGTQVIRDANSNFVNEIGWYGSGGGLSAYEPTPDFQQGPFFNNGVDIFQGARGVPDISADGSDQSGVFVIDSLPSSGNQWYVWGTSLSCPVIAGIVNDAGKNFYSSEDENNWIYGFQGTYAIRDIVGGSNGYYAGPGYDFVTGLGVPNGLDAL